jgi:hypothetical protein
MEIIVILMEIIVILMEIIVILMEIIVILMGNSGIVVGIIDRCLCLCILNLLRFPKVLCVPCLFVLLMDFLGVLCHIIANLVCFDHGLQIIYDWWLQNIIILDRVWLIDLMDQVVVECRI